jgi:translation initiation factor 1
MNPNNPRNRKNIVYSTNPDFQYETSGDAEPDTLPKAQQPLRVQLDKRHRGGKQVTLITGFVGRDEDLQKLAKFLKIRCGTGGAAKDGEIIIQGDWRTRVIELLRGDGYAKVRG